MALYTVVEEDYGVTIYRTAKAVSEDHANQYCLKNADEVDGEVKAATAADIAKELRKEGVVRLYPLDGGDWSCKIEKQARILR